MLTLPDFSGLRVHVIGDAIRDVYTQAKCLGAASKSPTLVYEYGERQEWMGGASVVAAHCHAAGAQIRLTTAGETIKERILVEGVKVHEVHSRSAEYRAVPDSKIDADVVIFADFQHGVFTPQTIPGLMWAARDVPVVVADSQTTDISWGNILDFTGCHLLFANEKEARFALRDHASAIEVVATRLWDVSRSHAVFLKRGAQGLEIYSGPRTHVPAYASQPIVDPIGAGDALLAYATLTYAVTKDLEFAGQIGSLAAAEACAHLGNVPVTREAIERRCQTF